MSDDPFSVLGLPARQGMSDDDVRAAWRRIAAATHPDRDDGGDPAAFGRGAAAFAVLRTEYGRGEALADLRAAGGNLPSARRHGGGRRRDIPWLAGRGRHKNRRQLPRLGRGGQLAVRSGLAVCASVGAFAVAGWSPACVGVLTGVLTWLVASRRFLLLSLESLIPWRVFPAWREIPAIRG